MPLPTLPTLDHLALDLSEDTAGTLTLDAMASASRDATHWPAIEHELQALLDWAQHHLPGPPGPLDEGHEWDHDQHHHDEAGGWRTVTLTLSIAPAAAADLQRR